MREFFAKLGSAILISAVWAARTSRTVFVSLRTHGVRAARSSFARATARFTLRTVRIAAITAVITSLALFAGWAGLQRVEAGTIGVKQVNFGGGGIVHEDYPSGLHFGLKGLHSWHAIDGRTQMISYG